MVDANMLICSGFLFFDCSNVVHGLEFMHHIGALKIAAKTRVSFSVLFLKYF